jgi:hypothetical protein
MVLAGNHGAEMSYFGVRKQRLDRAANSKSRSVSVIKYAH